MLAPLLESASLLDPKPGLDREFVLIFAHDVFDAAVSRVLEELDRALTDAPDEEKLLLVRERLGLAGSRVDAFLTQRLHGALSGLANPCRVLGTDALNSADLLLARFRHFFECAEAHA